MWGYHGDRPEPELIVNRIKGKKPLAQSCADTHTHTHTRAQTHICIPSVSASLVPETDFYFPNMFCSKSALSVAIEIQRKRDQYNRFGTWPKSSLTMCEAGIWNHRCISACLGDKNNSSPLCQGARGTMPRSEGKGATWVCKLAQAIRHGHLIL